MPIVTIETWPISPDQKPEIIRKITEVFVGMGVAEDLVTVVIHETHQDNWGSAGQQHSEKYRDIIKRMKSRTNINSERENS